MEDLPLGRIEALVPEFAVKDLSLGRTLMMMMAHKTKVKQREKEWEIEKYNRKRLTEGGR